MFLCLDYPYCLAGKELRAVIRNLLGKCSEALPELFDHCVYTMLREQDRQPGETPYSSVAFTQRRRVFVRLSYGRY